MREQGILADWNDARGFGFITPLSGGPRVFVHVSAFPRGRRPVTNDALTYSLRRDEQNRPNASDVQYVVPDRSVRTGTRGQQMAFAIATMFFALLVGLAALGRVPVLLLAPYVLFSLVGFAMYRADKVAAERGSWRISEANLLAIALVGGWPGALVARRVYRHKTTKQPFRTLFWGTVLGNWAGLAWLVYEMPLKLG